MDNLEHNPPTEPQDESLSDPYDSLRQLVISILVLVIVVSATLNVFLLRQAKTSRQDLDAIRPQVNNMVTQYQRNLGPAIDEFIRKLQAYAKKYPDFEPILDKHLGKGGTSAPGPTGPASGKK
jgi:hypothetical protein